jgi:hypothetical protein
VSNPSDSKTAGCELQDAQNRINKKNNKGKTIFIIVNITS